MYFVKTEVRKGRGWKEDDLEDPTYHILETSKNTLGDGKCGATMGELELDVKGPRGLVCCSRSLSSLLSCAVLTLLIGLHFTEIHKSASISKDERCKVL